MAFICSQFSWNKYFIYIKKMKNDVLTYWDIYKETKNKKKEMECHFFLPPPALNNH